MLPITNLCWFLAHKATPPRGFVCDDASERWRPNLRRWLKRKWFLQTLVSVHMTKSVLLFIKSWMLPNFEPGLRETSPRIPATFWTKKFNWGKDMTFDSCGLWDWWDKWVYFILKKQTKKEKKRSLLSLLHSHALSGANTHFRSPPPLFQGRMPPSRIVFYLLKTLYRWLLASQKTYMA